MKREESETSNKLPLIHVTKSKKLRCQTLKDYYESKIQCLLNMNLPPRLILLACWDAPTGREDLSKERGRKQFIRRCLKYYKKKLKEVEEEEKNLTSSG